MKKPIRLLIIIAISLASIISCSQSVKKEEKIKNIIARYNHALILAYKEGNFAPLAEVADDQALRIADNTYQARLNGQGVVLDSELLEARFEKIALGSGEDEPRVQAVWRETEKKWQEEIVFKETLAETAEKWRYTWVNAKTGKPAAPVITAEYEMEYKLDTRDGRLKVVSARILKEKIEKKE